MFTLTIDTGNAAFEDPTAEIVRLLQRVAEMVADGHPPGALYDANGNTVGRWERT